MKIISWNCNMAFRKKLRGVLDLCPDIIVIIECENKERLESQFKNIDHKEILWFGDNVHKGIAIIRFTKIRIVLALDYNADFRYIIPLEIQSAQPVNLFVIWAMPHETIRSRSYVGQVWAAINYYEQQLNHPSILIGDFNSNSIWDKTRKHGNHNDVVVFLKKKKIQSLYHLFENEEHGAESQPTQYMYRHLDKPYHLDYCFASSQLITSSSTIEVGEPKDWIGLSDHMPVIVEIDI